ncbi:MAG: hypothetical protein WBH07_04465 [Candidatus Methanoculleus thermohydrogenotrophicum]
MAFVERGGDLRCNTFLVMPVRFNLGSGVHPPPLDEVSGGRRLFFVSHLFNNSKSVQIAICRLPAEDTKKCVALEHQPGETLLDQIFHKTRPSSQRFPNQNRIIIVVLPTIVYED